MEKYVTLNFINWLYRRREVRQVKPAEKKGEIRMR